VKKKTKGLYFLDKDTLRQLESRENVLDQNIKYWLRTGRLLPLKKGVYLPADQWSRERDKDGYLEYLANRLLAPSYVSLSYVLAQYRLLSEAEAAVSSVTTKTGRSFRNGPAAFHYFSLSERLFTGYAVKRFRQAPVYIATKEKALFDFLYLRYWKQVPTAKSVRNLRINWENLSRRDFRQAGEFCSLTNNKNIKKAFVLVGEEYY